MRNKPEKQTGNYSTVLFLVLVFLNTIRDFPKVPAESVFEECVPFTVRHALNADFCVVRSTETGRFDTLKCCSRVFVHVNRAFGRHYDSIMVPGVLIVNGIG